MSEFNYKAAAELFPTRRRIPRRQPLGYKRFAQAAQAIRFAMEDVAPELLVGACLEVDEQRYGSDDIRRLYESCEYPLVRRGKRPAVCRKLPMRRDGCGWIPPRSV